MPPLGSRQEGDGQAGRQGAKDDVATAGYGLGAVLSVLAISCSAGSSFWMLRGASARQAAGVTLPTLLGGIAMHGGAAALTLMRLAVTVCACIFPVKFFGFATRAHFLGPVCR
jgi:hypothetical protein